jgi:Gpi18-like mannosyltransferase
MKLPMIKITQKIHSPAFANVVIVMAGITLAMLLRYCLLTFESRDFIIFTGVWYDTIKAQGFHALGSGFANYTPFYLYCLYLVSVVLPQISSVVATKLPSIAGDVVCAWYVYRLVGLKYRGDSPWPFFAFLAVVFSPTVVLNSSLWGQADSLYTAALMACLYYLLIRRKTLAMLAFGAAFAIKLQAVFFVPFLFILLLKRTLSWKQTGFIPLVYVLAALPSWLAGRPLRELATIYSAQAGLYSNLTLNAPTLYTWIPPELYTFFYPAGLVGAVCACYLFVLLVYRSRAVLTPPILIQLALASVMIVPYVLPKMHERYFFPGDVLSIVFAFYYPKYFYVPVMIGLTSFFAYQPFLFHHKTIPLPLLALAELFVLVMIVRHMMVTLYRETGSGSV